MAAEDEAAEIAVTLNGTAVEEEEGEYWLYCDDGENTVAVSVVNGDVSKTYTITVTKEASVPTLLTSLKFSGAEILGDFEPVASGVFVCSRTTSNATNAIAVTPASESLTVMVMFAAKEGATPTPVSPGGDGKYTLTWDFTESDTNMAIVVVLDENDESAQESYQLNVSSDSN